jgi:hypothetical protein
MTTPAAPATPAKATPGKGGKQQQVVMARRFRVGVQSHDENVLDNTTTLVANTVDLPVANVSPAGWLRHFYLLCEASTTANAAAVTFSENGPWNVYDSIQMEDVGSNPIFGPFSGYETMVANKFGGYAHSEDPRGSVTFFATAGAGAGVGGSFRFVLRIPVELVDRDALGDLANKSGTAQFKIRVRLAAGATVYGTAPTTLPSVRTRIQQVDWWDPPQQDLMGNPLAQQPPQNNTTQFWTKEAGITLPGGQFRHDHDRVGYGVRNLIYIYQDTANGTRATGETDFPDPATLQFEANVIMQGRPKVLWQHETAQNFGYRQGAGSPQTFDAAEKLEAGVYPLSYNKDFGLKPGAEMRRGYLWTSSGSRLTFSGSNAASVTCTILTNDVTPAGGNMAALSS